MTPLEIVGVIALCLVAVAVIAFVVVGIFLAFEADERLDKLEERQIHLRSSLEVHRQELTRLEASNLTAHAAIVRLEAHHAEEEKA